MSPIEVWLRRAGLDESVHVVERATADPDANGAGDGDRGEGAGTVMAFWRSSMKPFQALPIVRMGVLESLGLDREALAVACASHHGTEAHLEVVRRILRAAGREEAELACGPHRPVDDDAARALDRAGRMPGPLHNNCSGKHAAMLAACVVRGWPLEGYHEPEHPLQRKIRDCVSEWTRTDAESLGWGTDGCGVPTPRLALRRMAATYARFAVSGEPAVRAIVSAMTAHPIMVSGKTAFSARLMQATGGRLLAKEGAEGVFCVCEPGATWGAAFKVRDGAMRAIGPAVLRALGETGVLTDVEVAALGDYEPVPVRNTREERVASLSARGPGRG